ncbi:UDP-glucose 4-epimerase GalE [Lentisphaera profundi]|uniref:UDP-glucose 4-epimerase n=1 Tax=Lentisphaera profundi TaxID=1658616 RepID=A0ABY7VRD9_9BACT|nr:UDP-glucose 4-epimerase GalE [Lentisphaera profundi]WDE95800.1 UDP-glucose 4-epimerase GalE [Lentisphaera profundi]
MKKILITGGAGYIASHTNIELLKDNYELVLLDNFSNSSMESVNRVEELSGKKVRFYQADLLNSDQLNHVFEQEKNIDAVIHFAALKSVGESVEKPLDYYENNISGSLNLYRAMQKYQVKNIVFSSSATVYGDPDEIPVKEDAPTRCTNPYGHTKLMMEQILLDSAKAYDWNVVILRYFNPAGAHESGRIGEDPEYPANLLPFVSQVAAGVREKVMVFGNDWETHDGTGVRDYIHVVDLAQAHVKSIEKLKNSSGSFIYNIGTGRGYSVLEMISAFSQACGHDVPYEIGPRREGDIGEVMGDPQKSAQELKWTAQYGLKDMVDSAWKWQSENPQGYRSSTQENT